MNNKTPYTYLIGWSRLEKYYYGVRYAKTASPNDLWVKYFTSSHIVKRMRMEYGDPDIIQVRQTFYDPAHARQWEAKVLRRLKVHLKEEWVNIKSDTFKGLVQSDEDKIRTSQRMMGNKNTLGYTNEYRAANDMKIIPGKPKGSKESIQARLNKSNAGKKMRSIRDLNGKVYRVSLPEALDKIASGMYTNITAGIKKKPHSAEAKIKWRRAAANRPSFYCEDCDRTIKGKMNWDRHIVSIKHMKQVSYNESF